MSTRVVLKANADAIAQQMAKQYIESVVLPKMVEAAKRVVPVDTGDLQDSIHQETEGNSYYVIADSEYAIFVEQGTSKMAAQPFLRPAMSIRLQG